MNGERETVVVVGYGWIGQANAVALLRMGHKVAFYDPSEKIELHYRADAEEDYAKVERIDSVLAWEDQKPWYIICVGDRVDMETGEQDVTNIKKALASVKKADGRIILRSTVLPHHLATMDFSIYLPEFLHEQYAIEECESPFLFIVGKGDPKQPEPLFFAEWEKRAPKVFRGTPREASLLKYLSNIWNSVRIAFVNEFGDVIADSSDPSGHEQINRVINFMFENKSYVRYGRAYDGHCLPKDTMAFFTAHQKDHNVAIIRATHESNLVHQEKVVASTQVQKWYSSWEDDHLLHSRLEALEEWVRAQSFSQPLKPLLKRFKHGIEYFIPGRTIEEAAHIWDERAKENPLYYSNTRTPSGKLVSEPELNETGRLDFQQFIRNDELLQVLLARHSTHAVYDLGTGAGRMLPFFAETYERVVGGDISSVMLEKARGRVGSDSKIELEEMNGARSKQASDSITFLFSYQTLQHVATRQQILDILREMYRILKPGGVAKLQFRTGGRVAKWSWSYGPSFSEQEARSLLEQVGFRTHGAQVTDVKHLWLLAEK